MKRTGQIILPTSTPNGELVGTLTHDLLPAPSARRGRWACVEHWAPDPADDPVNNPEAEDVLPIVAVGASSFDVAGDYTEELHDLFPVHVRASTGNNGPYRCDGEPTFASGNTTITVHGPLPDATADGELLIVRPARLHPTGRKELVVSRSSTTAAEGTFVKATPLGFEKLIDVINCEPEEEP